MTTDKKKDFADFQCLEKDYLKTLPPGIISLVTLREQHDLTDLLHFGDFALVILELKPSALITFPALGYYNTARNERFVADRISGYVASVWMPILARSYPHLTMREVKWKVRSPHMPSLQGAWFAVNTRHPDVTYVEGMLERSKATGMIFEKDLARSLGYPAAIPEAELDNNIRHMQVGYQDRAKKGFMWTCFVAKEEEKAAVKAHFLRVRDTVRAELDVDLELITE
ncbi:hypothetical protein DFJ77DRAFT_16066 [Powellomyces hirtus]|nr:hypothetical protein DFJ77DRAFT_16066 [Powellomyces hirtus]